MDPITQQVVLAAAGTSAAADATYVDDVFSTYLYDGTGASQTITNGIDLSGEGGMVWMKSRETQYFHRIFDTERGVTKELNPSGNDDETTTAQGLTHFLSNGFTIGTDTTINKSGSDNAFVSWTFRKAPGFFDVVTYTGNGTAGRTVAHNLGSAPGMILIKALETEHDWRVYHRSIGATERLCLNDNSQISTQTVEFNGTEPTSSVFTVGTSNNVNQDGKNYVAYLFAHDDARFGTNEDESIIKCGTYEGNSGTQEIDLGFEPQWLMIKLADLSSSGAGDWIMVDTMRGWRASGTSGDSQSLNANLPNIEPVNSGRVKVTSQGFKFDNEANHDYNENNYTYVYMAIRRPHKPPTAGTDVFSITLGASSQTAGFPVDTLFSAGRATAESSGNFLVFDRQRGGPFYLSTSSTGIEVDAGVNYTSVGVLFDSNVGYNDAASNFSKYYFRRAPGFFDTVYYKGNSAARSINHNLEATPELIIAKGANRPGRDWVVYNSSDGLSATHYIPEHGVTLNGNMWNNTNPTATTFSVSNSSYINQSGYNYIAYLFASLPGVSKVGTYSGSTSNNVDVDCGFTAGVRFVLVHRIDTGMDYRQWYVWDSARGIVSGNDPFSYFNQAQAQVTNYDYIDPLSSGFTITSSAPADLNATGGTYLFLAIA
jgi:hypothetical protein